MAEIKLLGCPWHGRVQGGLLTLPNAATMDWPQPDGTYTDGFGQHYKDHSGFTLLQQLPNGYAVERTEDQAVEDAAAGMAWRQTAIVSGQRPPIAGAPDEMRIYGIPTGGYVYAAPDGSRWLIRLGTHYSWSASVSLSLPVSPKRFGEFGAASEQYTLFVTASASSMGQASPSITIAGASYWARVIDITPDGGKAIIELFLMESTARLRYPVGFLLLTLSGTPGINFTTSLTVLKTRTETLGTASVTNGIAQAYRIHSVDTGTPSVAEFDVTGYPTCGGYELTTYTLTATDSSGSLGNALVASGTNEWSVTGRIVAMWFDAAGVAKPVMLDVGASETVDVPAYTINITDNRILRRDRYNTGAACAWDPYSVDQAGSGSYSRSASRGLAAQATLAWDGQTVTESVSVSRSHSISGAFELSADPSSNGGVNIPYLGATESSTTTITMEGNVISPAITWEESTAIIYPSISVDDQVRAGSASVDTVSELGEVVFGLARFSNNLLALLRVATGADPSAIGGAYAHTGFNKSGVMTRAAGAASHPYGSYNPHTGEAVLNSETPVSWV